MIHKVKNAVTRRLHEAFGTGCEIYSEEVEQKAAEPFVFVEFFHDAPRISRLCISLVLAMDSRKEVG